MDFTAGIMALSRAVQILFSLSVLVRCLRSLLREKSDPEIWATLRVGRDAVPITHWENLLGRSRSADLRLDLPDLHRVHAVLCRNDRGDWRLYDVFSRGGVWVNQEPAGADGAPVQDGDLLRLGGHGFRFAEVKPQKQESAAAGRRLSPAVTLLELTVFQLFLLVQHAVSASADDLPVIALSFGLLLFLEWSCYNAMRLIGRSGFEVETLAFYLTTLGFSVAASSTPQDLYKQLLLTAAAVLLFILTGWWLRSLRRTALMRVPVALAALALLGVNVVFSEAVFGARN